MNYLPLVKIAMYDLMKHHFNYHDYPGIQYDVKGDYGEGMALVKNLDAR